MVEKAISGPSETYTLLVNQGPQPATKIDTGSITPEQKRDGIHRFWPRTGAGGGSSKSGGGQSTAVYYIDGKHDPETVVKKWVDVNADLIKSVGEWAIHHRIIGHGGDEWKQASRDLLGPFDEQAGPASGKGGNQAVVECPLCGETAGYSLATHLPDCDG